MMFRGFYTAASGMITHQRRAEMLTNNLANVNTPGFKAEQASLRSFPEMLLQHIGNVKTPGSNGRLSPFNKTVGTVNTGVYMQEAAPNFFQGDLKETGLSTDMALLDIRMPVNKETGMAGTVFFTVQTGAGELRYTRNGSFTIDGQGFLTTASGYYVLDAAGNRIQLGSERFNLHDNGLIEGENGETALLGIAFADNPFQLVKEGDGLFRTESGEPLASAYDREDVQFSLQQEYLEQSNVDPGRTMVDLLTAYRSFEANQKVLRAYDSTMDKAANEVGRVR